MAKSTAILGVGRGLFLNRKPLEVPLNGLLDGNNFRIKDGQLTNHNVGYATSGITNLGGPVLLIERFRTRSLGDKTVFGTKTDLFTYNGTTTTYITPRYATGTITGSAANPGVLTGAGTAWNTTVNLAKNAKAGDKVFLGNAAQNSLTARWYTIASVDNDTQITLTEQIDGGAGFAAGSAYTIRKLYTGDYDDVWDTDAFINGPSNTDWFYMTNGKDPISRWDGTGTAAEYSAATFTAKHLAAFSNMMIYGNLIQSGVTKPVDIINSNAGDPEDFTGLSEQFKVHDDASEIQRMWPLGDNLSIYSKSNVTLAQFVGDPIIFVFRKVVSDKGPVASRLLVDYGDYHEFIAKDQKIRFDGASSLAVGDQVWQKKLQELDPSRTHIGFAVRVEEAGEALWAVPYAGDGTTAPVCAYSEHYLEHRDARDPEPYGKRDFPFLSAGFFTVQTTFTWDTITGTWDQSGAQWDDIALIQNFPRLYLGDDNGNIYVGNSGQSAAGVAMTSFVRFGRRPTQDGQGRGTIARIYPFAEDVNSSSGTLAIYLHFTEHANAANTSEVGPFNYSLAQAEGGHFVTPYRRARYVELEFRMSGNLTAAWGLDGYDWVVRKGGYR